ncbi:MAG TPA: hypothetical protein VHX15_04845 [Frankiaceae bacterium]|nr:hypothetical protein [Frankiaceae bacterium]
MFRNAITLMACFVLAAVMTSACAMAAGQGGKLARGQTGQGRSIRIRVFPKRIKIEGFSIELHCSGGYRLIDSESNFMPSAASRKGQIHDAQVGDTDEILIRGHLRSYKLKGRIRVRDHLGRHRCSSPWVPFNTHA